MGFLRSYILSLLLNIGGLLPAVVLLVLHFVLGLSLWWMWGAILLWALGVLIRILVISWAARCGDEPPPYQENKNPYSVGQNRE